MGFQLRPVFLGWIIACAWLGVVDLYKTYSSTLFHFFVQLRYYLLSHSLAENTHFTFFDTLELCDCDEPNIFLYI